MPPSAATQSEDTEHDQSDAARPEADAWPDGAPRRLDESLDQVVATLERFVHFVSKHQVYAVALWIAHCHLLENFDVTPRLAIRAPSKQAGKTRLMQIINTLVPNGWLIVGPTAAVLFRKIEADRPTILLDEADRLFERRAEDTAEILQVLNTGHAAGSIVPRVVGAKFELRDFPAFAAVALAGIGTDWPDTILDRSIVINMERKTEAEPTERFRRRNEGPLRRIGEELAISLTAVTCFTVEPDGIPDQLSDRAQDGWEPLLAIADAAGSEWPTLAREAAIHLAGAVVVGTAEREELLLLRDVRAVFEVEGDPPFLGSQRLLMRLLTIGESPWNDGYRPLSTHRLARLLSTFGIEPRQPARGALRGYFLADIDRHWGRLGTGGSLADIVPPAREDADEAA
jgi:hypothetical protein